MRVLSQIALPVLLIYPVGTVLMGMLLTQSNQRIRLIQANRASEELFRTAFEYSPNGMCLTSQNGHFLRVNQTMCEMFGYAKDALLGMHFNDVTHPDDQEVGKDVVRQMLAGAHASVSFEKQYLRQNGEIFWAQVTSALLKDAQNQPLRFITQIEDITDRKKVERALQLSENLFSNAFRLGPAAISITRISDETFLDVNDSFLKLFGFRRAEVIHQTPTALNMWLPETRQKLFQQHLQADGLKNAEVVARSKTGKLIHLLFSSQPIAVNGEDCHITTLIDITELKLAEEEIRNLNIDLEKRVADRTRELKAANQELETFSYSVSHDLRAPLRAISGFASIISRRHAEHLNEEGQHYVNNIVQASERMGQLIDDLLTYSRLGRTSVRHSPVSLNDVFAEIIGDMAEHLNELQGCIEMDHNLPIIESDKTLLMQIFSNLLDNAITYRKPDTPPHIQISCSATQKEIRLCIRDNGIGIQTEYFEKIFNAFQHLHSVDEYPGTGIGLATVKKSVELLGGKIWVESSLGVGSKFCIQLPSGNNTA